MGQIDCHRGSATAAHAACNRHQMGQLAQSIMFCRDTIQRFLQIIGQHGRMNYLERPARIHFITSVGSRFTSTNARIG